MLLCALVLALPACAGHYPQSTLKPLGDFARMVDHLLTTTVLWAAVVFVLVEGLLIFVILKFRGRPNDPEPKQIHGNTMVEIVWTMIPALILAMIAVPTVRTIFKSYELPTGPDVVEVEVIGHQWWWEFRYPKEGLVTAGELHVPVGRPVALRMTTADVLHSFWVPQFAAKRDVFPGRNTVLYFRAEVPGNFSGQCAEFCGVQHGRMAYRVVAQPEAEFEAYLEELRATGAPKAPVAATAPADTAAKATASSTAPAAPADSLAAVGEKLFTSKGCIGCHSLDATKPVGIGPNLAKIGSRSYIAAGTLPNTDDNLAHWISDPQSIKHGVLMPNLGIKPDEAKALVAFLRTHK
jgi:cytochrome c oxidase subunit 2